MNVRVFKVLDEYGAYLPDLNPSGEQCRAMSGPHYQGFGCTLPYDHPAYCPHMAGTGEHVVAVWYDRELDK